MNQPPVLILGSNGQLGSDFKVVLNNKKIPFVALDRRQIELGIDNIEAKLTPYANTRYLINCTSFHNVDLCEVEKEKTDLINHHSVAELTHACKKLNITLVHFSTDYVFDGEKTKPYSESDTTRPLNVYGVSKANGEQAIQKAWDKYFIFRVSSLFGVQGPSGKGNNFVETMIKVAKSGKPLRVIDDQIMSPTHTLDIAKAVVTFIKKEINDYGIYHCSGEGACSWHEFAQTIFTMTKIEADLSAIPASEYPTKTVRPAYSVLDNAKINAIYQMPDWQVMLKEYLFLKGHTT